MGVGVGVGARGVIQHFFVLRCLANGTKKQRKVSRWLSECLKCFPFECFKFHRVSEMMR